VLAPVTRAVLPLRSSMSTLPSVRPTNWRGSCGSAVKKGAVWTAPKVIALDLL